MTDLKTAVTFHLEAMGYWNPSLICFRGRTDDGDPVELIQHVTQISLLLMKLQRKNLDTPKPPIGFDLPLPQESSNPCGQASGVDEPQ